MIPGRSFAVLQFGHGIIAVENPERAALPRIQKALQFGHGIIAVENSYRRVGPVG